MMNGKEYTWKGIDIFVIPFQESSVIEFLFQFFRLSRYNHLKTVGKMIEKIFKSKKKIVVNFIFNFL